MRFSLTIIFSKILFLKPHYDNVFVFLPTILVNIFFYIYLKFTQFILNLKTKLRSSTGHEFSDHENRILKYVLSNVEIAVSNIYSLLLFLNKNLHSRFPMHTLKKTATKILFWK